MKKFSFLFFAIIFLLTPLFFSSAATFKLSITNNYTSSVVEAYLTGEHTPSISCGETCTYISINGTTFTITAPAKAGYSVTMSNGCDATGAVGVAASCIVTMNADKNVTVVYTKPPATFKLSITNNYTSSVVEAYLTGEHTPSISCGETCTYISINGTTFTITAPAKAGYSVTMSNGCDATGAVGVAASCIVTMNADKNVTVVYTKTDLLIGTLTSGSITSNSASIVVGLLKGTAFVVYIQKTVDGTGVYFSNETGTTDYNGTKSVIFNGLIPNTTYKTFLSTPTQNNIATREFTTLLVDPVVTQPAITPPTTPLNFLDLFKTVKGAVDIIRLKKEGTNPGDYTDGSKTQLSLVLNERYTNDGVLSANEEFTLQSDIDAFKTKLQAAIDVFEKRKVRPATVGGDMSSTGGGLVPDCPEKGCGFKELMTLINNLIQFLLFTVATPLAAIIIAYVGWLYLKSGGNSGDLTKAKTILLNVVIGYVIGLAAWLIVKTIVSSLGVNLPVETTFL